MRFLLCLTAVLWALALLWSMPAHADSFPVEIPAGTYALGDHTHPQPDVSDLEARIEALEAWASQFQPDAEPPQGEPEQPPAEPAPTASWLAPKAGAERCAQGQIALGMWLWTEDMNMGWPDTEAWLGCDIEIEHVKIAFDKGFGQALASSRHAKLTEKKAKRPNVRLAIILDLYPVTRDEPRFCEIADGTWDAELRAYAQQLVETGHPDAILRLWHEMDLSARRWFQNECWVAAWRRVHDQMMSVEGAEFVWQYNVDGSAWQAAVEEGWPGDAYVDDVAASCYDKAGASFEACRPRLEWLLGWAQAHGKTLSWAEWGLWSTGNGDNPQFLEDSRAFFLAIPQENRGYMLYFNHHDEVNLEQFPNAKARFRELFGG